MMLWPMPSTQKRSHYDNLAVSALCFCVDGIGVKDGWVREARWVMNRIGAHRAPRARPSERRGDDASPFCWRSS